MDAIEARLEAEKAELGKARDDALYLAHHREQMFEQRESLVREMQGMAQKADARAERAELRIAELEAQVSGAYDKGLEDAALEFDDKYAEKNVRTRIRAMKKGKKP